MPGINSFAEEYLKKHILTIVLISLLVLSFFIIKQYIIALISAFVLAYLIKPVFNKLNKKMSKEASAILCILLIILLIIPPLSIVTTSIASLAGDYLSIDNLLAIKNRLSALPFISNLDIAKLNESITGLFLSIITSTLKNIPSFALTILVTLLGTYFMLIKWDFLIKNLKKYIPFQDKEKIASEISDATNAIIYGYFLIAIIELAVAFIGFYISGVKYPIIFAGLIAIFAFIPGVGPAFVWIFLTLFSLFSGNYLSAIGIVITGLIISIFIDTILVFKIIGKTSRIHPLILLMGILGGVPIFGIFGFIIGPLILVYTINLIQEASQ